MPWSPRPPGSWRPPSRSAARAGRQGPGEDTTELLAGLATDRATLDAVRLTHARVTQAQALGAELEAADLHPALAAQVRGYGDAVDQVEPLLADAVAYSGLVPVLLGLAEPTDLLVVVQTPAEVRSLGGLAGLVLDVRASGGSLEVRDTYAGSSVERADAPVLDDAALAEHYAVLGDRAGRYLVNAPMVPDGALASSLLAEAHVAGAAGGPTSSSSPTCPSCPGCWRSRAR